MFIALAKNSYFNILMSFLALPNLEGKGGTSLPIEFALIPQIL